MKIPKSIIVDLIESMEHTLQYTDEAKRESDKGYAFSYGYLQSHCTHVNALLKSLLTSQS